MKLSDKKKMTPAPGVGRTAVTGRQCRAWEPVGVWCVYIEKHGRQPE